MSIEMRASVNNGKSSGKPRLKVGGRVLLAVGVLALAINAILLAVFFVHLLSSSLPTTPTPTTPSNSISPTTPSNSIPSTSRGTFVYLVVDANGKVHTAFQESDDIRVVGILGRNKAIVEVSEKGKAALEANPRITFDGVPGKTFNDVKLRAGELTVTPLRTEDLELIARVVKTHGGTVKARCGVESNPDLRIIATDETIEALMKLPEARWIENYERPRLFNAATPEKLIVR